MVLVRPKRLNFGVEERAIRGDNVLVPKLYPEYICRGVYEIECQARVSVTQ